MKEIFNPNKRIIVLAIFLFICVTACVDLDETPLDFLSSDNAYTTVEGIEQGINGFYTKVRDDWYLNYHGTEGCKDEINYGDATDVAYFGEDPASTSTLTDYLTFLTPSNSTVEEFWDDCYGLIQYANVLIEGINTADESIWTDESEKQACLGEAMFFRAFAYRILVSYFGDVPLVTEAVSTAKTDYVRDPVSDIYAQMEEDLTYAATYLPEPGEEEESGRVTQGAAWHLLCEVYLAEKEYQKAVDAATQVIDGYSYGLMTNRFGDTDDVFGSGDVFLDLFAYDNQNLSENTEAIWVIQYEPDVTGGGQATGERYWGCAYYRMGNTPDGYQAVLGELYNGSYTGYSDTLSRPTARFRPTNYWAYDIWVNDWDNDIRNAKHNIKRKFYFDNPASAYDGKQIDFSLYSEDAGRDALKDTCQYIFPFCMKHADPCHHFTDEATSGKGFNHKDVYAMRLAETYLFRAEAYLGLGNQQLAADDINAIRNRANATSVSAADVDEDYLLDERARELYGEEWRGMVLRRLGVFVERVEKYNDNPKVPGANVQDYNDLWPIPQNEIDANVDAVLEQNPGY